MGINSIGYMVGRGSSADGTRSYLVDPALNITQLVYDGCDRLVVASSIHDNGNIVGQCGTQAFIRQFDGATAFYRYPGAQETMFSSITYDGFDRPFVTGWIRDGAGQLSGLAGDPEGSLTAFNAPNSIATLGFAVNAQHSIVGTFLGTDDFRFHGFEKSFLDVDRIFTIDVPGTNHTFVTDVTETYLADGFYSNGVLMYSDDGTTVRSWIGSFRWAATSASVSVTPEDSQPR